MSSFEKTFYYATMAMLYGVVVMRITHVIEASTAFILLTAGMVLYGIANHRHKGRLLARNEELEAEIQRLKAPL